MRTAPVAKTNACNSPKLAGKDTLRKGKTKAKHDETHACKIRTPCDAPIYDPTRTKSLNGAHELGMSLILCNLFDQTLAAHPSALEINDEADYKSNKRRVSAEPE